MPRGVFIHTSKTIQPLVCSFAKYRMGRWMYFTYRRGLWRCSFLTFGFTRASNREASNNAKLHAFFVPIR